MLRIIVSFPVILLAVLPAPAYSLGIFTPLWGICGSCRYNRGGEIKVTYPYYILIPAQNYTIIEPRPGPNNTLIYVPVNYSVPAYYTPDLSRPVFVQTPPVQVAIDPVGVVDFKLDFHFNPSLFTLSSIEFPDVFAGTSYDLSLIDLGIINNIRGTSSLYDQLSGNGSFVGDFATVNLEPILGTSFPEIRYGNDISLFAFYLSSGDYVNGVSLDPIDLTSNRARFTFNEMGYVSDPCEVPAPLPILGMGAFFSYAKRLKAASRRIKRIS